MTAAPAFSFMNKLTDRSRRAIVHGQHCAFRDSSDHIEPLHLLEGVTYVDGVGSRVLQGLAADALPWPVDGGAEISPIVPGMTSPIPFSAAGKLALTLSLEAALAADESLPGISTEHMLVGILDSEDQAVLDALRALGIDPEAFRAKVVEGYWSP